MYSEPRPVVDVKHEDYPEGWGAPRGIDARQEGASPAYRLFHFETLRIKLTREEDGRVTVSSPQLDIATFGGTELEAWECFLVALEDIRHFYFQNRTTLSPHLRQKLQIFEFPYVIQME